MVRDDGWQFLLLGRSLEQADMTSRMVASAALATGSTQWPSVLRGAAADTTRSCGRTAGCTPTAARPEFLIVDARFPRSVMHGLVAASDCLRKVGQNKPAGRGGRSAQRALGQLRAHLEYAAVEDLVADLDAEMTAVQDVVRRGTAAIAATTSSPPPTPARGSRRGPAECG